MKHQNEVSHLSPYESLKICQDFLAFVQTSPDYVTSGYRNANLNDLKIRFHKPLSKGEVVIICYSKPHTFVDALMQRIELAGYKIYWSTCSQTFYFYKNGNFLPLNTAYNLGLLNEEDICALGIAANGEKYFWENNPHKKKEKVSFETTDKNRPTRYSANTDLSEWILSTLEIDSINRK